MGRHEECLGCHTGCKPLKKRVLTLFWGGSEVGIWGTTKIITLRIAHREGPHMSVEILDQLCGISAAASETLLLMSSKNGGMGPSPWPVQACATTQCPHHCYHLSFPILHC